MKKIASVLICIMFSVVVFAQLKTPTASIKGNLQAYKYFYVVPTSAVTSSSGVVGGVYGNTYGVYGGVGGGATKTISPAETISGYLMKYGFNTLPSIAPEFADKTLVVSYGYTGRRPLGMFSYASCIIIQMRDAKTQELIASYEAEGCGADETDDILQAIYGAMDMFMYSYAPAVVIDISEVYKSRIYYVLKNETTNVVKNVDLKITYYSPEGEVMHIQTIHVNTQLQPNQEVKTSVKRDKPARSTKFKFKIDVVEYN